MNAVILAGGRGRRMRSRLRSKPMRRVDGRPILEHQISDYQRAGVTAVYIAEGYRGNNIRRHFGDGSNFGLNVHHLDLGLAMPPIEKIKTALEIISETTPGDVPVFVSTGDIITAGPAHLEGILTRHRETDAQVTIDVAHRTFDVGAIRRDANDNLTSFKYGQQIEVWSGLAVVQSGIHTELPIQGRPIEGFQEAAGVVKVYHDPEAAAAWRHFTTREDVRRATRELRGRVSREKK